MGREETSSSLHLLHLLVLVAGLVVGILTMHVTAGGPHDSGQMPASMVMGQSVQLHSSSPATDADCSDSTVVVSPDAAGHADHGGAPPGSDAMACSLSVPSAVNSIELGDAALVAVLLVALVVGTTRASPPCGRSGGRRSVRAQTRHALCVIRV